MFNGGIVINKKFSIIITVYNCSKYIHRCIQSILNQNIKNYEILLINDGSNDGSDKICNFYQENYESIIVIHQENKGVSFSRNVGLNNATGDYICFLDADDYLDNYYFSYVNQVIDKYKQVELFNFGFYSDVEDKELKLISSDKIFYENKLYNSFEEIRDDFINLWDNSMLYNVWNKIYLRKTIINNKIKFPNFNWGEDIEFNKLYLNSISTLYNSNKCYYHYIREREGAATNVFKENIFNIRKKEFIDFNNYFESWNITKDEYYEFSCRRYIERLLGCIENIHCDNMNFMEKYKLTKKMINDDITRETLNFIKPKSKKIFIMIVPIKFKLIILMMFLGKILHLIKVKFPGIFNSLKNRR